MAKIYRFSNGNTVQAYTKNGKRFFLAVVDGVEFPEIATYDEAKNFALYGTEYILKRLS